MYQAQQWDILTGPGITALGVAAARALESDRPDRLISDPYAAGFVAAVASPIPTPLRWPGAGEAVSEAEAFLIHASNYTGVRTRFFDELLDAACRDGCRQVVIAAAGLDARAYRLDWPPGVRLFEIDQPEVLAFKDRVLGGGNATAGCARYTVGINLQDDWPAALCRAGFRPALPTAWLAEGLLMYLAPEVEARLLAGIHHLSAPGSRLGVEHSTDVDGLVRGHDVDVIRQAGVDMTRLFNHDARPSRVDWLQEHGWSVTDEAATAVAQRYQRDLTGPVTGNVPERVVGTAAHSALLSARLPR